MDIRKFSASAMEVAELCLSRWDADLKAGYTGSESSEAAMLGSADHGAMEAFVKKAILEGSVPNDLVTLKMFYIQSYMAVFATSEIDTPKFNEGWELLERWYKRTSFEGFQVLMVEEKLNFSVPTGHLNPDGSKETIPFNFIFDRFDQTDETEYRVVDYKTLSQPLSPIDLHDKLQARVYGLAAQILKPDATRIWVGFDMLRWEGPIETFFSRDDNIKTWTRIKRAVKRIRDYDPDEPDPRTGEPVGIPQTLNSNCGWCVMKTTCKANMANVNAGGVWALDLQGQIDARALLKMHAQAASAAVKELDAVILAEMQNSGKTELVTPHTIAEAKMRGQRSIDPAHVRKYAGDELFNKYGTTADISLKGLDALLKDPSLPAEARASIENNIVRSYSDPYVQTKENKR